MALSRVSFPLALAVFALLVFVVPIVRHWRATGTSGVVVHKEVNPFQRVVGVGMAGLCLGIAAWCCVLVPFVDAALIDVWSTPRAALWGGAGLALAGMLVIAAAQAQMGNAWRVGIDDERTALVARGLFRAVRNPIYSGLFLATFGLVLACPSPWTIMAAVLAALLIHMQTRLEEQHLLALHGEAYRSYAAQVGRFVPSLGRLAA